MMAQQPSRKAFEEALTKGDALAKKKGYAVKGEVAKQPVDPERARFNALLRKVQKDRSEASYKR
jgi:hypothetical protein